MLRWLERRIHQWMDQPGLPLWYAPEYRLPLSAAEGWLGIEPRRADFVAWYLLQTEACRATQLKTPEPISYEHLQRVHQPRYLDSLQKPETLAAMLGLPPSHIPVDEVLRTMRLACGGTLAAARWALEQAGPAMNLLGGFHQAGPDFGAGLCPLNDVACALAALRAEGFGGRAAVIDLDAHQPVGTAACLAGDPLVWMGSISAAAGGLSGVEAFAVPPGSGNADYRAAFERLLAALPEVELVFVIAGGDVVAGDRLGGLQLDLRGVRRRDLALARRLQGTASIWLPGGGYHDDSWRVLAGTARVLIDGSLEPIPERYDPMGEHFAELSAGYSPQAKDGDSDDNWLSADDLAAALRLPGLGQRRLLDTYSVEAIDFALARFGILPHLRRLGYGHFRSAIDRDDNGDRLRLYGSAGGQEHLLVEVVLARERIAGADMLYVHWLTLRNPLARFSAGKQQLPGQEVPGLGLARETVELLIRVARRLGLAGLAYRPAWYHTAYTGRYYMRFVDPERQGRFEALMRDLAGVPLLQATLALAEGRVLLDGRPYSWEADAMAYWLEGGPDDGARVAAERERIRFALLPRGG